MTQSQGQSSLADVLRQRRKERSMTLVEIGQALDLANGNFIGMVERGERTPSDERLLALARVLDLDGRELLALKYRDSRGKAGLLLEPPTPRYPRMRRFLLSCCSEPDLARQEFNGGALTLAERLVFAVLLDQAFLPALKSDPFAPRRLRKRVLDFLGGELGPGGAAWWAAEVDSFFEDEAQSFIPWIKGHCPDLGWTWSFDTLSISVCLANDEEAVTVRLVSSTPLTTSEGGEVDSSPTDLPSLLRAEGLHDDDVDEILDLVKWKRSRRSRATAASQWSDSGKIE